MVRIMQPSTEIEWFDPEGMLKSIEMAGRTCYKSEGAATPDSHGAFVRMLIRRGSA